MPDSVTLPAGELARVHALSVAGRFAEALRLANEVLAGDPNDGEALFARATVWFDWGRVREAYTGFLQARAAGLDRTALHLNLAWSCQLLGMPEQAEPHARRALAQDPANAAAHFGLGTILQRLAYYPEAVAAFERVLELEPRHAQAPAGIGRCMLEQKDHAAAETWLRRAVDAAPENPQFRVNLGAAIVNQERFDEALATLARAAELERAQAAPPLSMVDTGFALVSIGRYREALEVFRRHLPVLPDPRAHGYYAFVLLDQGQLEEGWAQYEFRWMQEPHRSKRPDFAQPRWAGQDLAGRTILVQVEQGAGDIIHFARYAPLLEALGARVVLQVRPELVRLAARFDGVAAAFAPPDPPPPFDYHVALMSLPRIFGTDLDGIPAAVPYVHADPARTDAWRERVAAPGLKVGIAWAGNPKYPRDAYRSIAFDALAPLWDAPGVSWHSLQTPLKDGERERFPATLVDLGPFLTDFTETAAAMAQLDLVIAVDTAVAHLAGALGRPVWLLLPKIGDFRWLEDREDSPWYPTVRLFRQRVQGQWDEVIARVAAALQDAATNAEVTFAPPAARAEPDVRAGVAALAERLRSPAFPDIARVAETRHGILQYLPNAGRSALSLAWYGECLEPQVALATRLLPPGAHVLEAGCSVGEHTLPLARCVGVNGHVLAYESDPVAVQCLRNNVECNRVGGIVTLMRNPLGGPPDDAAVDTVDALALDRLDLVRIRTGARAEAIIDGADRTLWRLRPPLLVDAADMDDVAARAAQLAAFGYRCWMLRTPWFVADNFNRRDGDLFAGAHALALFALPEERELPEGFAASFALEELRDLPRADAPAPAPEPASPPARGPLAWLRGRRR